MKLAGFLFLRRKIDPPSPSYGEASIADVLRASAILATVFMIVTFFAGCVTEQLDSEGHVIRKRQADHEFHGEAGAYYGRSG